MVLVGFQQKAQLPVKVKSLARFEPAPLREHNETQERETFMHRARLRAGMDHQPKMLQPLFDGFFPSP